MAHPNDLDFDFWRRTQKYDPNEKPWDREWREYNTRQLRHHIDKIVPRDKLAACPRDDRGYLGERGFPLDPAALYHLGLQGPPPRENGPGEPDWTEEIDNRRPLIGKVLLLKPKGREPHQPFLQLLRYTQAGAIPDGNPQPIRFGRLRDGSSIYACDHEPPPPLPDNVHFPAYDEFAIDGVLHDENLHPEEFRHLDSAVLAETLPHPHEKYLPRNRRYAKPGESTTSSTSNATCETEPESSGSGPGSPSANAAPPLESTSEAQTEPWSLGHGHTETPPAHRNPANATRDTKTEPESSGSGPGSRTADTAPPLKSTSEAQTEPWSSGHGHTETPPAHRNPSNATRNTKTEPESSGSGPGSPTADNEEPLESTAESQTEPWSSSSEASPQSPTPDPGANGAIESVPETSVTGSNRARNVSEGPPAPGATGASVQSGNSHTLQSHSGNGRRQLSESESLPLIETPQIPANGEVTECNNTGQNNRSSGHANPQPPAPDPGEERPRFTRHQKYVLNHVAMGGTLCTAAEDLNCTPQRFYNWKRRVKHFGPALIEARELYTRRVADGFHEAETDARMLIHDIVRDQSIQPHIRLRAALAIMRRKKNSNWLPDPIEPEPDRPSYAHIPEEPEDDPFDQDPDAWPDAAWRACTESEAPSETASASEAMRDTAAEPWASGSVSSPQSPVPNPGANGAIESVPGTLVTGSIRARNVSEGPAIPHVPHRTEVPVPGPSEATCDAKTEPESLGSGPGSPSADTAPPLEYTIAAQAEPWSLGHGHNGASEATRHTSRVSGLEKIAGVRSEPERAETPGTISERSETMEHLLLTASATPSGHIVAVDRTPPITASVSACSATPREAWSETSPQSLNPSPGAQRHACSASPLETPGPASHPESRLTDYTVLAGESRIHFHELHAELQRSYEPKSPVEELTVLRLTQVFWVLRRLDGIETAVWDSDVEIQRTTNPRIPVVAALALSYLDINENQRTRFQQRLQKMRAVHERRVDELTNQLLRFRSQRENRERHDQRREERPEWQKAQATKAKHRHHYRPDDEIPGPSLFNRDAGEHLSARINPIQQTRAF